MRHKIIFMLFLWMAHLGLWAQSEGYNPTNPGDPQTPDTTLKYRLTLKTLPSNGGSTSNSTLWMEPGKQAYVSAYESRGFKFVAWTCDGETLSREQSFYYTMPNKNATLSAIFQYDPKSPGNPEVPVAKQAFKIMAIPQGGGYFSRSSEMLEVGSTFDIIAWPNPGYKVKQWMIGDSVVTKTGSITYTVTQDAPQVKCYFEYDPQNPGNPNKNYWNKSTGEVVVDDFGPGNLMDAIGNALQGSSRSDVQMITVAGKVNQYDFGLTNYYSNCTLIDLSRTANLSSLPSNAFSDAQALENVYLPASVERLGYRAFANCTSLSSITLYAMKPPSLESNVFDGVREGLVVYVPAASLSLYQAAKVWQDFTLMPIQDDIHTLTVALPDGIDASLYNQMWIELTNAKSGQKMHYVMTGRNEYSFANIIKNTTWNVTLRNQRGDVFAHIDGVEVKDGDVKTVFQTIAAPRQLSLCLLTPEGDNVSSQAQVTWLDAEGNYLATAHTLGGLLPGSKLTYRLELGKDLALKYAEPEQTTCTVGDNEEANHIQLQLTAMKQVTISGKIADQKTKTAVSGAFVTATQTFGGKYSKTVSAKTDSEGYYSLTVSSQPASEDEKLAGTLPTQLNISATDYVSQALTCDSLLQGKAEVQMSDILLKPITGATIQLTLNYKRCEEENAGDAASPSWYSDYGNIVFGIYDKTQKRNITRFNLQYPQIVLLEEVNEGDELVLTATSKNQDFMPAQTTAKVSDDLSANATFDLTELGKIISTFGKNSNGTVVGSLYDGQGKLVKTARYADATATFGNLQDGYYTLVSMGESKLFNTIYDLKQLRQSGLNAQTDYAENTVKVESGHIAKVIIDQMPTLNESKLYYTGDATSFTVNKQSIVAGNYLTLSARIDFKQAYAKKVSDVSLLVDIPDNCEFVENSVMVGNSTCTYQLEGNRLTVPMARWTDRVRFCVIPTLGGDYSPSAQVQFDIAGKQVVQPVGSATYTAKDLSINVPKTVAKTTVNISGTAIARSEVKIYDGEVLIGQTTSLANGMWSSKCELNQAYNLSTHSIYAKVTTKQGLELRSETESCLYDENTIQVKTVNMSFYNGWMKRNVDVDFDFENGTTSASSYQFYTGTDFTFVADLTNNDSTKVHGVTLYVYTSRNEVRKLKAHYDGKRDRWVASDKFESDNLPVNLSADVDATTQTVLDINQWNEMVGNINELIAAYKKNESLIADLFKDGATLTDEEMDQKLQELGLDAIDKKDLGDLDAELEKMNAEQLEKYLDSEQQQYAQTKESLAKVLATWKELLSFDPSQECSYTLPNGTSFTLRKTSTETREQLIADGFQRYQFNDSSEVYIKTTAEEEVYVDLLRHIYLAVKKGESNSAMLAKSSRSADDRKRFREYAEEGISMINNVVDFINVTFNDLLEKAGNSQKQLEKAIEEIEFRIQKCDVYIKNAGKMGLTKEVTKWQLEKDIMKRNLFFAKDALKTVKGCFKHLFKALPIVGYLGAAIDLGNDLRTLIEYYYSIPDPCPEDQANADTYKAQCYTYAASVIAIATADLIGSFSADAEIISGIVGSVASVGTSLAATVWGIVQKFVVKAGRILFDQLVDSQIEKLGDDIANLKCKRGNGNWNSNYPRPPFDPLNPIHDPSGYVYEAVESNRLQGVTATCYYKETVEDMYGDPHENIVKWNAEEYAQQNPLFTDENGMYRWDVPQGMWQVKFEKEGYETTYSEWLPVPPPQLEVNVGMKQNLQPMVKNAKAFENAIEMEFDKYMMAGLLNTDNIIVMDGEKAVEGSVKLLNAEQGDTDADGHKPTYATRLRFEANKPFEQKEITLMVSNQVKSYAGIRMQDDFQQKFDIEPEVRLIACDSTATIIYGEPAAITVSVLPASASAGKKLTVSTSSAQILGIESSELTIDKDGKAEVIVTGELPGEAALTYRVEGYELEGTTVVKVQQAGQQLTAAPEANIASGSEVAKGTGITLTCATPNATIYYTLDGSCPCLDTEARKTYDGTPIIISETTTIKAMATAEGLDESDVAEFTYVVDATSGIHAISANEANSNNEKRFNLAGQQVSKTAKGVIVVKNKKYASK